MISTKEAKSKAVAIRWLILTLNKMVLLSTVGSVVNNEHKIEVEIKQRIAAGNKLFYANKQIMFSK